MSEETVYKAQRSAVVRRLPGPVGLLLFTVGVFLVTRLLGVDLDGGNRIAGLQSDERLALSDIDDDRVAIPCPHVLEGQSQREFLPTLERFRLERPVHNIEGRFSHILPCRGQSFDVHADAQDLG